MELKNKIPEYSKKALTLVAAVISVSVIAWLNWQIISGWFGKNGPANVGSIEVSYVSMGKFILDLGFGTWAPFWYFGFPFHVFYTPLLPFLEAVANKFFSIPLWQSYRLLTGIGYILAPVSVFFLGWQLSKRVIGGLISGLLYSVGPTVFYFIIAGVEVARDRMSLDFWDPRRFTILVRWGEGPHTFSLVFLPLAGVFFARFLEKPKTSNLILTCVFVGLIALTNAIGLFATILLMAAMSFAKLSIDRSWKSIGLMVLTGITSLGLVSFWYNLTFISTFLREGGDSGSILTSLFPWGWIVGVVVALFLYFILNRFIRNFGLATALLWSGVLFSVVAVYYLSAGQDESYRRLQLLPQALRYNTEVDLSLSLLAGVLIAYLLGLLTRILAVFGLVAGVLGISSIIVAIYYIQPFLPAARQSSSTVVDVNSTAEHRVAAWMVGNTDQMKGERVLLPGNYGFYLNWFNYVWQLRGGLFQASTHRWPDHIYYQFANGKDPAVMDAWLTVSNIKYVLVTTPGTSELYKELKNLDRFSSMHAVYEQQGDIIYEVSLKRSSPAKPVSVQPIKTLEAPVKADDKKNLLAYADWVENSSANDLSFKLISYDKLAVTGTLGEKEAVLVQITADPGWSAYDKISRQGIRTGKDPLGFLMLYPKPGPVNIALEHHTSWQEWLGYLISILTVFLLFWFNLFKKRSPDVVAQNPTDVYQIS
ncbi:hypothetical protein HYW46_01090 [Candidatus Daviesbacteria bacterium]|nr:hypothetical protein [Candidatus Daviesbacteria bacterium]